MLRGSSPPAARAATSPASGEELNRERSCFGGDRVDLGQQHGQQLFLWHGAVKLTFLENHALAAAACNSDVGVTSLGRAVYHTAHDRDRDRNLEPRDVRLHCLNGGHHVVLEAATGRTRDESRGLVPEGKGFQ